MESAVAGTREGASREIRPRAEARLVGWARSPFAASVVIAAVLVAVFVAVEVALGHVALLLSGEAPVQMREDFRIAVVLLVIASYIPAATVSLTTTARRTARELGPALRAGAGGLADAVGRVPSDGLRRAGIVGVVVYLAIQGLVDRNLAESFALPWLPSEALVHRLVGVANGWLIGRFVLALVATSRRLFRLGAHGLEVDLLDLAPAAPLARQALRHTLLVLGLLSLFSLMFVDVAAAPGLWQALAGAVVAMVALATLCLALPLLGARRAIAAAKARELALCNEEIRRRRRALEGGALDAGRGLADLVAYKEHVAGVGEWILDAPLMFRFALYLALPLGSWLGGALVERVVEGLLE